MFAKRAMTELGFSYTIVENGKLAVDAWKRYRPKIILMESSPSQPMPCPKIRPDA